MAKAEIIKRPVEKIGWDIKKSAWTATIQSLVILVFGIFLVVWPGVTMIVVANVLGAILILSGLYKVINYFVVKGQNDFFNNDLLSGVIAILIGIAVIVIGDDIAGIFRIVIGIWMIYEALVRVNTAIKMNAAGIKSWSYILIVALVMLVLGIFVVFNAGAVMQLIGAMMIITGIVGIVGDVMFIQYVDRVTEAIVGKVKSEK